MAAMQSSHEIAISDYNPFNQLQSTDLTNFNPANNTFVTDDF